MLLQYSPFPEKNNFVMKTVRGKVKISFKNYLGNGAVICI